MSAKTLQRRQALEPKNLRQADKPDGANQTMLALSAQQTFVGPIPHPDVLKGYEEISTGFADRIITMAEKQSEHRMKMESEKIHAESRDSSRGVWFAFILGIGSLAAATAIALTGQNAASSIGGSLLGITGIGSIAVTFIKSTRISHRDR